MDEGGGEYSHQYLLGDDLLEFGNRLLQGGTDDLFGLFPLLDDADSSGVMNDRVQADADHPSGIGYSQQAIPAAAAVYHGCDAPLEQCPLAAAASADAAVQVVGLFESPEPAAADIMLSAFPDHVETMEVAEMVRVAAQCVEDDDARTAWSEEEQKELLHRLDLYAKDDAVTRCFKIAFHLPKKTAFDVASRCRWLQDKRKTPGSSALGIKLNKVKGTKIAKISNKTYPLSKEALDSKSTKQLIEDNNMFLKRIEENVKTGQLANTPDYFSYVKSNMDAILERGSEFGISMTMPPIDERGIEEILRARLNSLDLTEDA